jgi:hypothetical protein
LVRFLFQDDAGVRPLHEVDDPRLLDEIGSVRSFVEETLTEPSCDELDVVFWKDEDGTLKMTVRGPDHVVHLAKSLIGDRAAVPPTQH